MGGNYSSLPVAPTDFQYFFMYFWHSDTIKLALANEIVIDVIRQAVSQCWRNGIQNEQLCEDNSYEIVLYGKPFKIGGRDEAIQTKRFCCKMLADLRKFGWTLVTTSDLSQTDDRSTLFFHRNSLENRETLVVCVSLSWTDSLQLINAPTELKEIFKDTAHRSYWLGVQEEFDYGLDFEIKLQKNPWNTSVYETSVCGRKLLLDIIRQFERRGCLFYGTANMKETADSLFFVYDDQYPPTERCDYIMVSLNQTDKLRLFSCPQNLIDATRSEIEQYWRKGLRNEINSGVVFEFQMGGHPWNAEGKDTVGSRFFILMLLQKYLSMGWRLVTCMDITRKQNDKSVFIFKSCYPISLAHFCISLNETDKFRLLNAPKEVVDLTRRAISQGWPQGIKDEYEYYGSHQFVLHGHPFGDRLGNEFLLARCVMLLVLKALTEAGWRIICSADISSKSYSGSGGDYSEDVHSWYFVYAGNAAASSSIMNSHATSSAATTPSAPPIEGDSDDLPSYSEVVQQFNATEIDSHDLPTYSEAGSDYLSSVKFET